MTNKSLDDPFNPESDLRHGVGCSCASCCSKHEHGVQPDAARTANADEQKQLALNASAESAMSTEDIIDRAVKAR